MSAEDTTPDHGASAARGDGRVELQALYRAHVDAMWRIVATLGVPAGDVEDVVHEAFMIAQRRLADLDVACSPRAWLVGIARNLVLHHRRGLARRTARLEKVPEPLPVVAPDQQLERARASALMQRFLEGIDEKKRTVFLLVEIEGWTAPEVAEAVGVPTPTVYTRLAAARSDFDRYVGRLRETRRHA